MVARDGNKDDVAGLCQLHDVLRDGDLAFAQFTQKLLALLLGSIPDEQRRLIVEVGRAMVGEIAGHEMAHSAEPDPPDMDLGWEAWCLGTRVWQPLNETLSCQSER